MKITNLEQTAKMIKTLAGRKPQLEAVVDSVEGKTLRFSPDPSVRVEVKIDSNKEHKLKVGDKIAVSVEAGSVSLVERAPKAPKAKKETVLEKVKKAVTLPKTKNTSGASASFRQELKGL